MKPPSPRLPSWLLNGLFALLCLAILFFLWRAPKESTRPLPRDDNHRPFQDMDKKEAERSCLDCHGPERMAPLPGDHPPPYRCLFCHKRGR